MYSMNDFENQVFEFNRRAGKLLSVNKKSVVDQLKLIKEELQEAIDGAEANDSVEVLDGCIDVMVTAFGLKQMLEAMDYSVMEACELIAENNLTKFIYTEQEARDTIAAYEKLGIDVRLEFDEVSGSWVAKNDKTDKVLKPVGFKSVEIEHCVPEEL